MSLLPSFDDALSAPSLSSGSNRPKQTLVGGLLSHTATSPASLDWNSLTLIDLTPHSHGLCSSVYRRSLSANASFPYRSCSTTASCDGSSALSSAIRAADGVPNWICIKRVAPDEQPRPHSVSREIALLELLSGRHRNVTPLLAAVYDTSDPFGTSVDLVMPLYAATLDEVFQEPSLVGEQEVAGQVRPAESISHLWTDSPSQFMQSVSQQLLAGIAFLHDQGVAHRDIKPSNVLLSHTGIVKLIDLGTAFTATTLTDPLQPNNTRGRDKEQEWNGGKMVSQVGTGQFRAPELLFAPIHGYDAFAIDVWAVGVILAHFFTPLVAIPRTTQSFQDERQDWQKAFDSNQPLSSSDSDESTFWQHDSPLPNQDTQSASGYIRQPLFAAETGDIGLAASIFALLGLPQSTDHWPEAQHFQPPLRRLPFTPTQGNGLLAALPLFNPASHKQNILVNSIIAPALSLSASRRPPARTLLAAIEAHPPPS